MLPLLVDDARLAAYETAITAAVAKLQRQAEASGGGGDEGGDGVHVLTLGAGGGVLPLLTGRAGASRVTALERSRMLYRMAKQTVEVRVYPKPQPFQAAFAKPPAGMLVSRMGKLMRAL